MFRQFDVENFILEWLSGRQDSEGERKNTYLVPARGCSGLVIIDLYIDFGPFG